MAAPAVEHRLIRREGESPREGGDGLAELARARLRDAEIDDASDVARVDRERGFGPCDRTGVGLRPVLDASGRTVLHRLCRDRAAHRENRGHKQSLQHRGTPARDAGKLMRARSVVRRSCVGRVASRRAPAAPYGAGAASIRYTRPLLLSMYSSPDASSPNDCTPPTAPMPQSFCSVTTPFANTKLRNHPPQ